MAKIRTLKAEFFRDEDISAGGLIVKALAAGLICCLADDEGRFKVSLARIKGEIFTHDHVSDDELAAALKYLHDSRWLVLYGRSLASTPRRLASTGAILAWTRHQRVPISRFTPSSLPPPPNTRGRRHGASTAHTDRKHDASGIGIGIGTGIGIGKDPSAEAQTGPDFERTAERFADFAGRFRVVAS